MPKNPARSKQPEHPGQPDHPVDAERAKQPESSGGAKATTASSKPRPRWLSDDQQQAWRAYLRGSALLTERIERDLRCVGISLAEYEILVELSEAPDHTVRMSELADGVHQSRSRLTHTIARLEKAGYVGRCKDTGDGRGVSAKLLPEGYAFLVEIAPGHVHAVREAFVDIVSAEDFAAIGRAFQAVTEHNDRK